jgi:hypothetical protein
VVLAAIQTAIVVAVVAVVGGVVVVAVVALSIDKTPMVGCHRWRCICKRYCGHCCRWRNVAIMILGVIVVVDVVVVAASVVIAAAALKSKLCHR